jgi:phosphoadenosine phosphosulfate reductase
MRHETLRAPDAVGIAAELAARFEGARAEAVLAHALGGALGRVALVSSFGAESVVLLHMAAAIDRDVPVLFLDTEMLFPETLDYQRRVADALGLRDVRRITPEGALAADPDGTLHRSDPDACCALRKTAPLARALPGFDGWITGRKRFQSTGRARLPLFEAEATGRIKVNPLARWGAEELRAYMAAHALPRHPLVARGYPSIGCAPCTVPADAGDPRAGRWKGLAKDECGIHFVDGRAIRRAS